MQITLENGRKAHISDEQIKKIMAGLHCTEKEAIAIWLDDEGYTVNTEQNALCEKAKSEKITQKIHEAHAYQYRKDEQKTQKQRAKKENPTKEMIISEIVKILPNFAENIQIVNAGKLVTFTVGENSFKLDLVQQRAKKS